MQAMQDDRFWFVGIGGISRPLGRDTEIVGADSEEVALRLRRSAARGSATALLFTGGSFDTCEPSVLGEMRRVSRPQVLPRVMGRALIGAYRSEAKLLRRIQRASGVSLACVARGV